MPTLQVPLCLTEADTALIARFLRTAAVRGFFGSVELSFQNGRLAFGRLTTTEKPDVPAWVRNATHPTGGAQ